MGFNRRKMEDQRREAEDVLCEAGACILHLPDFYGPRVKCAQRGGHWRYDRTLKTTSCSRACQSEILVRCHFGDWCMINLQRFDPLGEIGGVSADMDYIANAQRGTRFELHAYY